MVTNTSAEFLLTQNYSDAGSCLFWTLSFHSCSLMEQFYNIQITLLVHIDLWSTKTFFFKKNFCQIRFFYSLFVQLKLRWKFIFLAYEYPILPRPLLKILIFSIELLLPICQKPMNYSVALYRDYILFH